MTASGMRLKKPIKVPRPNRRKGQRRQSMQTVDPSQQQVHEVPAGPNPYSAAINMLSSVPAPRRLTVVDGGAGGAGEQETSA